MPFLESLFGLLFTNFLWVGLWDLLDNTIFPNDDAWQMYLLVRGSRSARHRRPLFNASSSLL